MPPFIPHSPSFILFAFPAYSVRTCIAQLPLLTAYLPTDLPPPPSASLAPSPATAPTTSNPPHQTSQQTRLLFTLDCLSRLSYFFFHFFTIPYALQTIIINTQTTQSESEHISEPPSLFDPPASPRHLSVKVEAALSNNSSQVPWNRRHDPCILLHINSSIRRPDPQQVLCIWRHRLLDFSAHPSSTFKLLGA